ncbi:nuclear transport factor 2 family protein [Sphingobacterium daejeonense]|uniref:Nuclear transport factor 2 family protein n=1 Tax=Sphingobacterium daejeonense TaxID=371142 RepID=A0ABW3RJ17_9SPHI
MKSREEIIENYIAGYNSFDIEKMTADLDDNIKFENISNGNVTDSLIGKPDFIHQAEQAKSLFSQRQQKITSIIHHENSSEVTIDYVATLAIDISESLKTGDKIKLEGKSIFEFSPDGKILVLRDVS